MTKKHGSSSMKLQDRVNNSSVFVAEAKAHLLAFSITSLIAELYLLYNSDADKVIIVAFPFYVIAAFLFCCIFEHGFDLFVSGVVSRFFAIIPSLVLLFTLRRLGIVPALQTAVVIAVILRLCIRPVIRMRWLFAILVIISDILTLYLYLFADGFESRLLFEKILCICLVVLTMHNLQLVLPGRDFSPFPIHFFLCVGLITALFPMRTAPIDWSPVVSLGEKIAEGIETTADNASYFFSSAFGNTYIAGYSSFSATGGRLESADRLQLLIKTDDLPYRIYQDPETSTYHKVRRTLYLAGGRGADAGQFVRFLVLLYQNGIDRESASLFTEVQDLTLEYVYLDTRDEIAPSTVFLLTERGKKIESGVSTFLHKKGYRTAARYLDIDYASPYLTGLLKSEEVLSVPDYDSACDYARYLWDIDLTEILSGDRYEKVLNNISEDEKNIYNEYLDITGADEKLLTLAGDITDKAASDYEKCRLIESFLRQYSYTEESVGGYDAGSDMSTPRGLADISERFLFDTKRGYCVHFTSSMVMLLRLSGIPARAVTGYRYAFPFEKANEYKVSSGCAHTWPEAYIRGAGWMPFEPTSGYYSQSESSWRRYPALSQLPAISTVRDVPPVPAPPQTKPIETDESHDQLLLAASLLWPVSVSAIVLLFLLIAGTRLFRFLRYRYSTPREQLLTDVEIIKKNLVRISGHKIYDRGILSDYIPLAPGEMQDDINVIFSVCYRLLYADEKQNFPTTEENTLARKVRENLEKEKTYKPSEKSST